MPKKKKPQRVDWDLLYWLVVLVAAVLLALSLTLAWGESSKIDLCPVPTAERDEGLEEDQCECMDHNDDCRVTAVDALIVLHAVVGLGECSADD